MQNLRKMAKMTLKNATSGSENMYNSLLLVNIDS